MTQLERFDYDDAGLALSGLLASPPGPGPHPAVLVMHDAIGIGEVVKRRTRDLAELGYVALAGDMYGPAAAGGPVGAAMSRLHADPPALRRRVGAALDALVALPQVDAGRIGAIGFCFGGQCVLELARSGAEVKAVVSFHGLLSTALPAEPETVRARVLAITGAKDPYAPLSDVDGFQREMAEAGADWQLTVYGQGWHAFTDPDIQRRTTAPGVRYDPTLDALSWRQACDFLAAAVRG